VCAYDIGGIGECWSSPFRVSEVKYNLLEQAEVKQACRNCETDREQANHSSELEAPNGRLVVLRRRSAQFLNPSQLGFVLRPLPDERSDTALIVCRERNEAEGLQPVADGGQHLCSSEHGAGFGQEHQPDPRSLVDGLRERKQTSGDRNHLKVGPDALAIWKPKHDWIIAVQMSAGAAPRRARLGRAAHNQASVSRRVGY